MVDSILVPTVGMRLWGGGGGGGVRGRGGTGKGLVAMCMHAFSSIQPHKSDCPSPFVID